MRPKAPPMTPRELFGERLAQEWSRRAATQSKEVRAHLQTIDLRLDVHILGSSEAAIPLRLRDHAISIAEGSEDLAALHVCTSIEDFTSFVSRAVPDPTVVLSEIVPLLARWSPSPAGLAALRRFQGDLVLEIRRDPRSSERVQLHFGGEPIPGPVSTTISLSATDLADLFAGRLDPKEAFFTGAIRLDGDLAFVLRLARTWLGN